MTTGGSNNKYIRHSDWGCLFLYHSVGIFRKKKVNAVKLVCIFGSFGNVSVEERSRVLIMLSQKTSTSSINN